MLSYCIAVYSKVSIERWKPSQNSDPRSYGQAKIMYKKNQNQKELNKNAVVFLKFNHLNNTAQAETIKSISC